MPKNQTKEISLWCCIAKIEKKKNRNVWKNCTKTLPLNLSSDPSSQWHVVHCHPSPYLLHNITPPNLCGKPDLSLSKFIQSKLSVTKEGPPRCICIDEADKWALAMHIHVAILVTHPLPRVKLCTRRRGRFSSYYFAANYNFGALFYKLRRLFNEWYKILLFTTF